jgi:hypothetical protein
VGKREKKEILLMIVRTWTTWNLIREPLRASGLEGKVVAGGEEEKTAMGRMVRPTAYVESKAPRKEGKVIHH